MLEIKSNLDKLMIELDASSNKSNLGANSILAVSMACLNAYSVATDKQMYELVPEHIWTSIITSTFYEYLKWWCSC